MRYSKPLSPEEIANIKDEDIDYSDIPPLPDEFWENCTVRMPAGKTPISIRLDDDIVAWFKAQGKGYQTHINAVLRSFVDKQTS